MKRRNLLVILDTSFLNEFLEALLKARSGSGKDEVRNKIYNTVCNEIIQSLRAGLRTKLVFVSSLSKDERKALKEDLRTVVSNLMSFCRAMALHVKVRMFEFEPLILERLLPNICRDRSLRYGNARRVDLFMNDVRFNEVCRTVGSRVSRSNLVRKLVDNDLHIVITALYYNLNSNNVFIVTSDEGLFEKLKFLREDPELPHEFRPVYVR